MSVHHGDCLDVMRDLIADGETVDSCVTDPPYHLTSIVKRFGGANAAAVKVPEGGTGAYARASAGFMGKQWDGGDVAFRPETWTLVYDLLKPGAHLVAFSGTRTYHRMVCAIEDAGFEIRDQLAWVYGSGFPKSHNLDGDWQGWGTALKPAWEPICLARKPLIGTVAANVLAHGTGALNIDGCRVEAQGRPAREIDPKASANGVVYAGRREAGHGFDGGSKAVGTTDVGRWPANLIHDGCDEVLEAFAAYGERGATAPVTRRNADKFRNTYGAFKGNVDEAGSTFHADQGTAARFFYCAKAGPNDRFDSKHPTVKPVALMRWLCRLVTPPKGVVLDPFAGTGTTGVAALREGFTPLLIEREAEYHADIHRRIAALHGTDTPLFTGEVA